MISRKFISVCLIPLKENLSLNKEEIKYIPLEFVHMVDIDYKIYGFLGSIKFNITCDRQKEKLWKGIKEDKPFAIKIRYEQEIVDKSKNDAAYKYDDQASWSILGFPRFQNNKYYTLEEYFDGEDSFLNCEIIFCDPIRAFTEISFPKSVYINSSYSSLLLDILKPYDSIFKINPIEAQNKFYDEVYWLAVNCNTNNLYEYMVEVLESNNIQLIYSFDKNSDKTTYELKDIDLLKKDLQSKDSAELAREEVYVHSFSKGKQTELFTKYSLCNTFWINSQNNNQLKSWGNNEYTNVCDRQEYVTAGTSKSFDLKYKKYEADTRKNTNKSYLSNLKLNYPAYEKTIMPLNIMTIANKGKKNKESVKYCILAIKILIHKKESDIRKKENTIDTINDALPKEDYIKNESNEENYKNMLDKTVEIYPELEIKEIERIGVYLPTTNYVQKPIVVYGKVYSPRPNTLEYFICLENGIKQQQRSDINNSQVDDTERVATSLNGLYYLIELPSMLRAGKADKKLIIPASFSFNNDHSFIPLREGTPVKMEIYQENAIISEVCWISTKKEYNSSKDVNKNTLILGNGCAVIEQESEYSDLSKSKFNIESQSGQMQGNISIDQNKFVVSYQSVKGSKE
ncbi:hypothetical protein [Francisella adeliensis]|uniref:Uncharacterized protein n=1 Tax=Francisella adeliensis TaxID=2007306 RepID=A0A2Z4Y0I4_9GAMM|nr:hypothetical protein [Francisella adeliensis]AXA34580.1 hypothetical protein CDH04_09310 [Francisella adeliensis]MBK2086304.1 hypothetical protein [Francisella adeliensis]MBK2096520.1 hypothetical protein [Francisella adeliensis]QIW12825.1 hypothetical protein FZC43_09325 [Francisella adeliensis]QIW14702.1 hypothetical protein FZC44_09315 [Francisella adeliensis]